MSRHVAHVQGRGLPTPGRVRRQRRILEQLGARYPALPRSAGAAPDLGLRPIASFAFSMRTSPEDAVSKLVAVLDEVDPKWREVLAIRDGFRDGPATAVETRTR